MKKLDEKKDKSEYKKLNFTERLKKNKENGSSLKEN